MRLPSEDDAQGNPLCLHEQHLLAPQDRASTLAGHPFYMACRAGAIRLRDHQPLPQPREEGDKRHLHLGGAAVGRARLHLA